jgi:hypothetical protein
MRLLQRPWAASVAFGVIGNETWWFPAGFAEGLVWSKALHREETVQFWT